MFLSRVIVEIYREVCNCRNDKRTLPIFQNLTLKIEREERVLCGREQCVTVCTLQGFTFTIYSDILMHFNKMQLHVMYTTWISALGRAYASMCECTSIHMLSIFHISLPIKTTALRYRFIRQKFCMLFSCIVLLMNHNTRKHHGMLLALNNIRLKT